MSYLKYQRGRFDEPRLGVDWAEVEGVIRARVCSLGSFESEGGAWMIVAHDPSVGTSILVEMPGVPASYALDVMRVGTVEAWDGQSRSVQPAAIFLREDDALRVAREFFEVGRLDQAVEWRPQDEVFLDLWSSM